MTIKIENNTYHGIYISCKTYKYTIVLDNNVILNHV